MKKALFPLYVFFFVAIGALIGAPLAYASVQNPINTINVILGQSPYSGSQYPSTTCGPVDITQTWTDINSSDQTKTYSYKNTWNFQNNYPAENDLASFATDYRNQVINNTSGWGVYVSKWDGLNVNDSNWDKGITVINLVLFNPTATMTSGNGTLHMNSGNFRIQKFFLNPNSNCRWQADTAPSLQTSDINYSYNKFLFMATDGITNATDTTGGINKTAGLPPIDKIIPYSYSVTGMEIKAHYTGDSCLKSRDGSTCSDFNILWLLNDGTGNLNSVNDSSQLLGSNQDFTFKVSSAGTYGLSVNYENKGIPFANIPDGYNYIPGAVSMHVDGSSFTGSTATCVVTNGLCQNTSSIIENCSTASFPFIDINRCTQNLREFTGLLSFNTVKLGNNWVSDTNCHSLTVLGTWLSNPNVTVCPEFPQNIRDIVTPFVTFLLGIVTISFIARNKGSSW